jgi:predicted heme/steroid binding protein
MRIKCMKEFSKEELARYNGKNGTPAYVAFRGRVYDMSGSSLWKDGKHQVLHDAGLDLTDAMELAPHGGDILERFPVIGTLQRAGTKDSSIAT